MIATDNDSPLAEKPEAPGPAAPRRRSGAWFALLLLAVLALAGWLRFTGLNWDSGSHLHPDERFLTIVGSSLSSVDNPLDYFRTSISTLNPYNFGQPFYVYGNFPMTVTRYVAEWATGLCDAATARAGAPPAWCAHTYSGYDGIQLVGRFLSALVDMVSIFFTFLIGRRLYGRWAGLLAALLLALAVMPIQQSHFFTMDNWATALTTLALYAAVRAAGLGDAAPRFQWRWFVLFGVALGLAVASRINMAPLALVIGVSAIIWMARARYEIRDTRYELRGAANSYLVSRISYFALLGIALAAIVSLITFRVAMPYAFMDAAMARQPDAATGEMPGALEVAVKSVIGLNPQFLANMREIQSQQSPEALFPPAIQWTDRPAILFPLSNMILYGTGFTAGVFAWFAVLWALWRVTSDERRATSEERFSLVTRRSTLVTPEWMLHAIPLFWTLTYFLYMGTRWVKSVRYFLPLYPALFVLAGWAVVALWHWAQGRRGAGEQGREESNQYSVNSEQYSVNSEQYSVNSEQYSVISGRPSAVGGQSELVTRRSSLVTRWAVIILLALIIVPSLLWALMFTNIYRRPMTRIDASDWIFANVPSGATLLYDTPEGKTAELNLPLKGMLFEENGVPLFLDFTLPTDGVVRAVRFNYLSDPDFDTEGAADDAETIRVRVNEGEATEHALALDGQRRAVVVELPAISLPGGQPARLTVEGGPGGPIRAGTSLLVNEHWDDLLPVGTGGRNAYGSYYTEVTGGQRPVTNPDSPEKREEVIAWLNEADYVMISSQRAIWNLPRMALTYPMMMRYYEALFSGELGFELVAQFHGDTRLGPLHFSDTTAQLAWGDPPAIGWPPPGELAAEEAFSVYDHPPVWIFRKTEAYDSAATRALLEAVDLSNVVVQNPLEATKARDGLMLTDYEAALQRAGGAFHEVFAVDGLLSTRPWLAAVAWMAALVLLGWAAFPLAFVALRGLPDRGYALSRVLALLIISYLPWLTASIKFLPFSRGTIALALLLLVAVSGLIFIRRRAEIVAFLRARAGYILLVELLGVGLFLLMAGIRLGNPDVWDVIWGGEKPMDLSYFTAVMRSTVFPPYDPWHAGGTINYYYYGFVFVGALTKLLGVVPAVAYNLALPMLFSMTGLGVFALAWNLVKAAPDLTLPDLTGFGKPVRSLMHELRSRAAVAGFVAVALALLLGNLAQVSVIGKAWYQTGSASLEELPLIGGAARTLDGGLKMLGGQRAPVYPGDWFWLASRAINANEGEVQPITEFPFFTFLYGDLHAHMISMPLQLLALGWAVAVVLGSVGEGEKGRRGEREKGSEESGQWSVVSGQLPVSSQQPAVGGHSSLVARRSSLVTEDAPLVSRISYLVSFLVGALAIGALRPTNTWDWPTYLLLGALALAYAVIQREGLTWRAVGRAGLLAVGLFAVSSLLFLPYVANYGAAYNSVSLWPGSYTNPWNYFLVWGLFLFIVITHLAREWRDWAAAWTEAGKRRLEPFGWLIVLGAAALLGLMALLLIRGQWVGPLALPLIVAAGLPALRPGLPAARRVVLALMSAALGLSLLVELIVLDGDVGRMNTVFKFYLQAWLLLSVACGPAAVWAWPAVRRARFQTAWKVVLGVLLFAALLYPLLATPAKWGVRMNRDAPHTLDGAAFLDYVEYGDTDYAGNSITIRPGDDVAAIDWLQRNVSGTPVIMEAFGGNPYRSTAARVAMYTGLPAVIGWDWHQRQQRAVTPGTMVGNRIDDVNNFYNTLDAEQARAILHKYGVEYIFLGSLEKAYYWPEGLAKFDGLIADGTLVEVYRDETARILQVAGGG